MQYPKKKTKGKMYRKVMILFIISLTSCMLVVSPSLYKCKKTEESDAINCDDVSDDDTIQKLAKAEEQNSKLKCLSKVLTELPIQKGKDKGTNLPTVFPHHGDAGHWQVWNRALDKRFKGLKALDRLVTSGNTCSVWEVGANVAAQDSKDLMALYGTCKYHAFEPVPDFNKKLEENWKDENQMTVHKFGIGGKDQIFGVSRNALKGNDGDATFLDDSNKQAGEVKIHIKSFDYVLEKTDGIPSMVEMNCEGCEWNFLMEALKHGWIKKVPIVQIGWHSYGDVGIGLRAMQLCDIRVLLSETHVMDYGLAFGWERWSLKE
mmetsp:Transcript_9098/g.13633  ORF Transcript_9098/g.13633 Transcript_9098/m.13633 type:complete len:319 (-) Transcript_9098:22-978(-)